MPVPVEDDMVEHSYSQGFPGGDKLPGDLQVFAAGTEVHFVAGESTKSGGAPALKKKCSKIIVEPFDDCWPDIRSFLSMSWHDNRLLRGTVAKF